jgi:Asp-tRNA(Asn)/Glu-tRNA(Gln) amidotransferase A subunit family amidase
MDVQSYCDMLANQLVAWKAKIYDVIRVVDTISDSDKEKYYPTIRSLHDMVSEIDTQLEHLKTACPADWSPNRETIDSKMNELRQTLKHLSEQVGGPLIPDSLSWVSE